MPIDYELVVNELKGDLEKIAKRNGDFAKMVCEHSKETGAKFNLEHKHYIKALNDALKATSKRYNVKYTPISEEI